MYLYTEDKIEFTVTEQVTNSEVNVQSQDITVLNAEEIETLHAVSVADVLETVGGVFIKRSGAYGSESTVYVRGFSGSAVAILVDGVQMNSAQNGLFDLSKINADDIYKIEIIRGASDYKYAVSGAVGGIINIITKNVALKGKNKISFNISELSYLESGTSGIFDTLQVNFSINKSFLQKSNIGLSDINFSASALNAGNKFMFTNPSGLRTIRENNSLNTISTRSNIRFSLPNDILLQLNNNLYMDTVFCPGNINSTTVGLQKSTSGQATIECSVPYILDGFMESVAICFWNYDKILFTESYNLLNNETSTHILNTYRITNNWKIYCTENITLYPQGEVAFSTINSTDCINNFQNEGGVSIAVDFLINDFISVTPFCKLFINSSGCYPIPKLGTSLTFLQNKDRALKLNLNAYRMFVTPTLNQLYWKDTEYAIGNADLVNETGWGGDLTAEYSDVIIKASLGVYGSLYYNKIQWITLSSGKMTPNNAGKAAILGGRISCLINLTEYFTLGSEYNLTLSYLLSNGLTLMDRRRIMYTPVNCASMYITYKKGNYMMRGECLFTGSRYISNINVRALEPYFLLNANASYNLKNIELYINARNILNTEYYQIDDFCMPGVSVTVGCKIASDFK